MIPENRSHYRPEIDGLRAIAVLLVILCHGNIALFKGGFIGVDIFFVISGFLISRLLIEKISSGNFSLLNFYSRRARRIFPALAVISIVTIVTSYFILLDEQFLFALRAFKYLAGLISNYLFMKNTGNYWAHTSNYAQPFLHTWSISVEEQFYILFPLLLMGYFFFREKCAKFTWLRKVFDTRYFFIGILGVAIILCLEFQFHNRITAYYSLRARGWELLLGGVVAVFTSRRPMQINVWISNCAATIGLLLIGFAAFSFNESLNPFLLQLVPCLGTALIIIASSNSSNLPMVARLLSFRYLTTIGLLSYSLYLWHWPIFVFSRSPYWTYWQISNPTFLMQLCLILFLSFVTWRFVEMPFLKTRENSSFSFRSLVVTAGGLVVLILLRFAPQILPSRTPLAIQERYVRRENTAFIRWQSSADLTVIKWTGGGTKVGYDVTEPSFVVLGDSFASMWGEGLNQLLQTEKKSGLIVARPGCVVLDHIGSRREPRCDDVVEAQLDFVESSKIKTVILANSWFSIDDFQKNFFVSKSESSKKIFIQLLSRTLARLEKANKKIFIVLPVVGAKNDLIMQSLRSRAAGGRPVYHPYDIGDKNALMTMNSHINELKKSYSFEILNPLKILCTEKECLEALNGKALYDDHAHLSDFGSTYLAETFVPVLKSMSK